jgi:hypothetical protein
MRGISSAYGLDKASVAKRDASMVLASQLRKSAGDLKPQFAIGILMATT